MTTTQTPKNDVARLDRAAGILDRALDLGGGERAVYLEGACADDGQLREEVESMLNVHDEAGDFLAAPTISELATEKLGTVIDGYKLLQLIGEGGFGAVYMAEQTEPIKRRVALKIIKLGMDTRQVIARFEAERQALAMMDHPNIAKVLDAGATSTGRPYFVMELVKGVHITEYCDQNRLSARARLELFMQVCHAVQHAHQKGIIHRDIKPSNVMVTLHDGNPVPKVIDFGIAKATNHRLTEKTLFTEYHQLVGTPEYMSPEQAEMSGLDVDTRTDIYSLGVLLYELLIGTTPFDADMLRQAAYGEIQRIIREVEPPKPSTRLSTMGDELPDIARHRKAEPNALRRLIRGDLDWIVMKALEKDRTRRYETASQFAQDVERHLTNEAVLAGPPRATYRLRKFIKRNRAAVSAGSFMAATIVVGLTLSMIGFVQASDQRDQAESARNVAQEATAQAETDRDRAVEAKQEARRQSYIANVIAAGAALSMSESRNVHRRLDAAPEEFRNWEWRYIDAQMDNSLAIYKHDGPVQSVVFRPDGTLIALGGDDKAVRLWDASTGRELAVFGGHGRVGSDIASAFSPDRRLVALESNDNLARVWDVGTGRELAVLRGHKDVVNALGFSPDGTRLASGAGEDEVYDYDVRLWDVASGNELAVLRGHEDHVNGVAFSPDGERLASASCDCTVRLWDVSTGEEQAVLQGHRRIVGPLAFSSDGTVLASGSWDDTVRLWDPSSGKKLAILRGHHGPIRSVTFSPDGKRLASASSDNTVRLWDVSSGTELAVLHGHKGHVNDVAFSPDGTRLASASSDGTVRVWDASPVSEPGLRGHEDDVVSVAFSPDGTRMATGSEDRTVRIWDASTGEELAILRGHEGDVYRIAFSPDGTRLASPSSDSTVRLWDTSTGRELAVLQGHEGWVGIVAFSPDGSRLASASLDHPFRIWDTSTGEELAALRGHEDTRGPVAFSPDGTRLASASIDYSVRIWDSSSGNELGSLPRHGSAITGLAFSPDGTRLATSSGYAWASSGVKAADNSVRIWDVATGQQLAVLQGHEDTPWWIMFSPDGTRLASASGDKTVRVWDTSSGEELVTLRDHEDTVNWVAFSPDGTRLASASADKTVRIWDAVPFRDRYKERQAILAAAPKAKRLVDELWNKLNDWEEVARRLREDDSLSAPLRRAAANTVLRRATAHPAPDSPGGGT